MIIEAVGNREILLGTPDTRIFRDLEHELTLPDGSTIVIFRAARIRISDGKVDRAPRMAHVPSNFIAKEKICGLAEQTTLVGVSSDVQAVAALERREADLALITNLRLLKALRNPYPVLAAGPNEAGRPCFVVVARRLT